ncbi:MAG: hypothetical protein BWY21_02246 [Parcubacteria group bacterium ADurb.Bin216]|nr:MAG: hypothetical protein BWY21_02246 [Parcubacteria group bacterium ADurb.Bin216]
MVLLSDIAVNSSALLIERPLLKSNAKILVNWAICILLIIPPIIGILSTILSLLLFPFGVSIQTFIPITIPKIAISSTHQ